MNDKWTNEYSTEKKCQMFTYDEYNPIQFSQISGACITCKCFKMKKIFKLAIVNQVCYTGTL